MPRASISIRRLAELLVERWVRNVEGRRVVSGFIEAYARTNQRRAVVSTPIQLRNLVDVITREILLLFSRTVEEGLSRRVVKPQVQTGNKRSSRVQPTARTTGGRVRALVRFRDALIGALAWEFRWKPDEIAAFRRDLELYIHVTQRGHMARRSAKASRNSAFGPFADRCAIVLDPSFFDKARHASSEFQTHLENQAKTTLAVTLRYLAD